MKKNKVILQNIECNIEKDLPDTLFFNGKLNIINDILCIKAGETVSFDTYFNLLSIKKYKEYTNIKTIDLQLTFNGKVNVIVYMCSDNGNKEILKSIVYNHESFKSVSVLNEIPIENCSDYLCLEIIACSEIQIKECKWVGESNNVQNISVACCFCTYKREDELKKNIDNIYNRCITDYETVHNLVDIIIVDNGNTILNNGVLKPTEHLFIFNNKNYGGSAGFTRCLIETCIKQKNKYSHVILMDDDAVIEPYVLERTISLLQVLKEDLADHMIGGALLSKNNPVLQKENGAYLGDYGDVRINGKNKFMDSLSVLIENEKDNIKNYNGWFYCCIPSTYVNEENLPLPLFIHGDDQEFGKHSGREILTMNGIAVWHPDPNGNHRPYMNYYDSRNALIIASEFQTNLNAEKVCHELIKMCVQKIVKYQYEDAWYIIRGFSDFYNGIDAFLEINPEQLNREIMNLKKIKSISLDLKTTIIKEPKIQSRKIRVVKKLLNVVLPPVNSRKVYSSYVNWEHIDNFLVKEICIIDTTTGNGFCLKKNIIEVFRLVKAIWQLSKYIKENHSKLYTEWSSGIQLLKTYKNWQNLLEL